MPSMVSRYSSHFFFAVNIFHRSPNSLATILIKVASFNLVLFPLVFIVLNNNNNFTPNSLPDHIRPSIEHRFRFFTPVAIAYYGICGVKKRSSYNNQAVSKIAILQQQQDKRNRFLLLPRHRSFIPPNDSIQMEYWHHKRIERKICWRRKSFKSHAN